MSRPDFSREWLSVPGAQSLLEELERELRLGVSHCVLFPDGTEVQDVINQLFGRLWNSDVFVETLDLQPYDAYAPGDALASAYIRNFVDEYLSIESLITHSDIPEVTLLGRFETLPAVQKRAWMDFLIEWAELGRRRGLEKSICLLSTASAWDDVTLPPSALRLRLRLWHGVPSVLEASGVYRKVTREISARTLWREAMVTSLASGDLALGEELWEIVDEEPSAIIKALRSYADQRRWTSGVLTDSLWHNWHPAPPGGTTPMVPGDVSFRLWARGWIVYTPEYGEEMHAALVALKGDDTELTYRMWRAQAPLILPLAENIRLLVCRYLVGKYGVDWARLGGEEANGPFEELGKLEVVLRRSSRLYWERDQWLEAITLARNLRNQLAHYSLVTFANFAQLWQYNTRIHQLKHNSLD